MVKEELEAPDGRLSASTQECHEVRGAQEPVAADGAKDLKVAGRKHHGTDR
jgi:hypothetical protein